MACAANDKGHGKGTLNQAFALIVEASAGYSAGSRNDFYKGGYRRLHGKWGLFLGSRRLFGSGF